MKKVLTMLLVVAFVVGMMPAMANPTANSTSTGGSNVKDLTVNTEGSNTAASDIAQALDNSGDLSNRIVNVAVGGNADADSANIGLANSGAASVAANSNDSQGDSHALAKKNKATVTQNSAATAVGGDPYAYNEGDQTNTVDQSATAVITNDQALDQTTNIEEYQQANAFDLAKVVVIGPFAENDSIAEIEGTD